MRGDRDDDAWTPPRGGRRTAGSGVLPAPGLRTVGLVAGFVLAVAATAVVFVTDNPQLLRLAVIAAAWAFVVAAFLAGRRRAEAVAAAEREDAIRRSYEHELDRTAAASREYEHELRREAEESMAAELTSLRAEVAELSLLRHEVARVARLGTDLPALSGLRAELAGLVGLRDDVAQLAALRADVAALTTLREDLAQLGELRADVGRLRAELAEQLNGEMLIERIMLRTQSSRAAGEVAAADGPRTVEAAAAWDADRPPRELTGGWPAVRLDELTETRQAEHVRVDRPAAVADRRPREPQPPRTAAFPLPSPGASPPAPPAASPRPAPAYSPPPPPPTPLEWLADRSLVEPADLERPRRSRHSAEPDDAPVAHERSAAANDVLPPVPPRRRRTDEPVDDRTTERPAAPATSYEPIVRPSPSPRPRPAPGPAPAPAPVADDGDSAGHQRLAEILADNGVQPAPGGRRRRRYRDDDEPDDVLARVLGRDGR
ncbi:DUF6779 domain-containing protein [Geodermatophilus sp. SYSU D00815]